MTDHHLVPDDDLTEPARQGEVPDWFATPDDAVPVVAPDEPVAPEAEDEVEQPADEETGADLEDADREEEEIDEEEPYIPPVGTRRRRPSVPGEPREFAPPTGRGYACADVITAIFLLLTVLSVSATILLLANPRSPLNPFPAPTYPPILVLASPLPTDTPTLTFTPEPATPTVATPTPSPSPTLTPTATPTVTNTPLVAGVVAPTVTVTAQAVTQPQYTLSPFPFTVKPIRYVANTTPEGCDWQSIAGTVSDLSNQPIKGLAVRVSGSNGNVDEIDYSGTKPRFGESGFEIFLGVKPREDQYTIQLLGRTGAPISDAISIETKASCDQNVVIVNFVQNHAY